MYTPLFVILKKCNDLYIKSLALTDINMISTMYFYKKCKDNNIKPIIGLSTLYDEKVICLYARNHKGYEYLIKVNLEKKINIDDVKSNKDNIVIVIPYESRELFDIIK